MIVRAYHPGAEIRAALIGAGVLQPGDGVGLSRVVLPEGVPVLRIDSVGRQHAAVRIAQGGHDVQLERLLYGGRERRMRAR